MGQAHQAHMGLAAGWGGNPRVSLGGKFPPSPFLGPHSSLLAAALGHWGCPQTDLPSYIRRGRGKGGDTPLDAQLLAAPSPLSFSTSSCSGCLAKPCRIFTSTSTTTPSCYWTLRGDLHHHLRCSLERGEEGLHRHRTHDRVRKCCRNAAPDDRPHQHMRSNLVRLWNLRGLVSNSLVAQILID